MDIYLEIWDDKTKNKYNRTFPCFIIENNGWDDFGYKTLFQVYFCRKSYDKEYIGDVKILHNGYGRTVDHIKDYKIVQLNDKFCSIGQSLSYYRSLGVLGDPYKTKLLTALNDVVYSNECCNRGKKMGGFYTSLLRNSEAERIFDNRNTVLEDIDFAGNTEFIFTFKTQLENADKEHEIEVDFTKESILPNRIFALIGKNATGKTQVLSKLAESIVVDGKTSCFDHKPKFSKIIAISYSVFDEFYNPREMRKNYGVQKNEESSLNYLHNYIYCGVRDGERILSINDIKNKLRDSMEKIKKIDGRVDKWRDILREIIEPQHDYIIESIENEDYGFILSSGQHILVSSITEVIANIESESLIIFDEPEVHLHPNAISNLMRMLNLLLDKFNSYAILSTHSPLIIQEIPAKYVRIFERSGNITSIKLPLNESFGENISSIIDDIFRVENYESNFKACLKEMFNVLGHEELLNLFKNKLSFNALTYLNILSYEKERKSCSED